VSLGRVMRVRDRAGSTVEKASPRPRPSGSRSGSGGSVSKKNSGVDALWQDLAHAIHAYDKDPTEFNRQRILRSFQVWVEAYSPGMPASEVLKLRERLRLPKHGSKF
jgi:hypothetical protein